jgi:hypothetical protein
MAYATILLGLLAQLGGLLILIIMPAEFSPEERTIPGGMFALVSFAAMAFISQVLIRRLFHLLIPPKG